MYIHRSCHTRNWGEGAFAPPPLDGQGKASTPPLNSGNFLLRGKSSESKMSLVKVVANDSSYCSKFFLF